VRVCACWLVFIEGVFIEGWVRQARNASPTKHELSTNTAPTWPAIPSDMNTCIIQGRNPSPTKLIRLSFDTRELAVESADFVRREIARAWRQKRQAVTSRLHLPA